MFMAENIYQEIKASYACHIQCAFVRGRWCFCSKAGFLILFSFFFSYELYFQQTVPFMTPPQKNAMLVDCLQSLRPKVRLVKSTFAIPLFFDAFTYVHP